MDFQTISETRQSCRKYDPTRSVGRDEIAACLAAARLAPSACNSQPYHFTVATGEFGAAVGACTRSMGMNKFTVDCPAFIVVEEMPYSATAALGAKRKQQDYRSVDIGIAVAYLTARAAELGLSSCILGWFEEKKLAELLQTQRRIRLVVALGYAAPDDALRKKTRKTEDALVTWR